MLTRTKLPKGSPKIVEAGSLMVQLMLQPDTHQHTWELITDHSVPESEKFFVIVVHRESPLAVTGYPVRAGSHAEATKAGKSQAKGGLESLRCFSCRLSAIYVALR